MARFHTTPRRRGVVLLVILSLLVLFALLGVTFAIVAGQYRKSSANFAMRDQSGDEPGRQLDSAMYLLVRDTTNSRNPLRSHGMLTDTYGNYVKGHISNTPTSTAGGQFIQFEVQQNTPPNWPTDVNKVGYYNGSVLTFTSGALKNVSTHIVGYRINSAGTAAIIRALRPRGDNNDVLPGNGDGILINGRAFTGTGAGFNDTTGKLDMGGPMNPHALRPNRIGETNADMVTNYLAGGANESYDAPDFQNMFLAAIIPDASNAHGVKLVTNNPQIIPSFHRPALVRYAQSNGLPTNELYKVVMRPVTQAQGGTAGPSFPTIDLVNGPWDVDNDNDGLADSVWIDLDFPMQTSPEGRAYKPLFAILCVDMDGKLNLNYQGNFQHVDPTVVNSNMPIAGGGLISAVTVKGSGLGPGEVNLGIGLGMTDPVQYRSLLQGDNGWEGRYGAITAGQSVATPGGRWDALDNARFFEIPTDFVNGGGASYMSMPDLQGQLQVAVDHRGQLQTSVPTDTPVATPIVAGGDRRFNTVYRTRLPYDARFTPAEMERLLRYYDIDATALPRRLEYLNDLFSTASQSALNRRNVTVESRDMPIATAGPVFANSSTSYTPVRDPIALFRARLGATVTDTDLVKMVDPALFHGLKMDLNRPLGNGREPTAANQQNQVVDEPSDNELNDQMADGFDLVNGLEDLNGNGTSTAAADIEEQRLARYQLAKHLYVLASIVTNTGVVPPDTKTQFALAQWAINVVDFRDADSIMTPFEFDINPFNGWSVDGSLLTNGTAGPMEEILRDENRVRISGVTNERFVVWGCERPELLLTETLNLHDRRTTDTSSEPMAGVINDDTGMAHAMARSAGTTDDANMMNRDEKFDQQYLPQGSSFIEIYNPWASAVERRPAEFYYDHIPDANGTGFRGGVQLDQVTPTVSGQSSPVWRVLIVKDAGMSIDPDEPDPTEPQLTVADRERSVYFTDLTGRTIDSANHGQAYFTDQAIAAVMPGHYAVVGSGPETGNGGSFVTYLGYRNDLASGDPATQTPEELAATRQIILRPDTANDPPSPGVNQFAFDNRIKATTTPPPVTMFPFSPDDPSFYTHTPNAHVQPVVSAVINRAWVGGAAVSRRFSISEPVGGYTGAFTTTPGANDLTVLTPVMDNPLDNTTGEGKDFLMKNGTRPQHRVMHLQRLANPLAPWNDATNPYLTIDSIGADLTCFNGVTSKDDLGQQDNTQADGTDTLQRGDYSSATPTPLPRNLWKRSLSQNYAAMPPPDTTHFWGWQAKHTLGYMNSSYGEIVPTNTGNYLKGDPSPNVTGTLDDGVDAQTPSKAFPLLMWNNRPFNSVYELQNVPRTRSSRLTRDFNIIPTTPASPYGNVVTEYGHLMNFRYTVTAGTATPPASGEIRDFYRIFDYLRVPSKFVESDTYFANDLIGVTGGELFHKPFNRYSNFRDPGMINVNTIYAQQTWQAILNGASGPTFDELVSSRRGYGATGGEILQSNSQYPTEFTNPFRSAGSGRLVPPLSTMPATMERNDVEVTLLRSRAIDAATTVPNGQPLFAGVTTMPYNDVTRHAAMRSATEERLSNTLTTRSNVYSVWITVGYFEVDPNNGLLGQEVGTDTGEIRRHRAFYMIDRSIPVAFEPGENHNVDRAVLLRRFIE